jgi:hypothetical protein
VVAVLAVSAVVLVEMAQRTKAMTEETRLAQLHFLALVVAAVLAL